MTCERCGRAITADDERERFEKGDRDQPSYTESACRFCSPSQSDLERARDAHLDRLEAEAAENGWCR